MDPAASGRSIRGIGLGMGILACAVAVAAWTFNALSFPDMMRTLGALLVAGNCLGIPLMLARARRRPAEAAGWKLLAASQAVSIVANAMMAPMMQAAPGLLSAATLAWIGTQVLTAALQCWALLGWPWSPHRVRPPAHAILGSLIFTLSLVLLFWTTGSLQGTFGDAVPDRILHTGLLLRTSVVAGTAMFLLSESPDRSRGVLGLFLVYIFFSVASCFLQQAYICRPQAVPHAVVGFLFAGPFVLALAAWSDLPLTFPGEPGERPGRTFLAEALGYGPFLCTGALLGFSLRDRQGPVLWHVAAFVMVAALQVLRESLLMARLRRTNLRLETKVRRRTRALEEMQTLLLRTERMNAMALLGAGISHDLNNMLNTIAMGSEVMEMEVAAGIQPSRERVAALGEASRKAAGLTTRLMSFGKDTRTLVDQDLGRHLESLLEILRMMAGRRIQMDLKRPRNRIGVAIGRDRVEQVLVNLVANARDAMPEGGQIHITLGNAGPGREGLTLLTVSDTGPGIPASVLPRIFEPFYTTKDPGKGTGLGLASVKAMLEDIGGSIEAGNRPQGGAIFRVLLPLASSPPSPG